MTQQFTGLRAGLFGASYYWPVSIATIRVRGMGENETLQNIGRRQPRRIHDEQQAPELVGRRLLDVIVYGKGCRIGDKLTVDDLAETSEVGDWKMPAFKMACTYAVAQGWLIIEGDVLKLTTAGYAAA